MSLDWYAGQKCVLIENLSVFITLSIALNGMPVPVTGVVYTVSDAEACDTCGAHIKLKELGGNCYYPCEWFRPVEPQAMEVLRGLLTPEGGMPTKQTEEVKA